MLYVLGAIVVCALVVLRIVYAPLRLQWLSAATSYYSVRMIAYVGYETAWLFWLMNRLAFICGEGDIARDSARMIFAQARMGRVDAVSLHRSLLVRFGALLAELGVADEVAAGIVATIRREGIRREEERPRFFSDEESREILMLLCQAVALAQDPPRPPLSKG
jgi:hypothetical protein